MVITRKNSRLNHSEKPLDNCHILLIEDQQSIAAMAVSKLKSKWNCDVTVVRSYAAAEAILESNQTRFFVALSDLNLPDAGNGEIIDLLIKHQQSVIAVTGHFDKNLHADLTNKGIIDYVLKKNINAYDYLTQLVGRLYLNQSIEVLVVDDSKTIQKMTGAYLEKQFLKVSFADNGEEALEILQQANEIKLVLVDSQMPVMDGLTFTAKARQIKDQNNLCIIGISSSEQKDLSAEFLKNGANDFISKPFSYDEITCRVNQNLTMLEYMEEMHNIANMDFLTKLPNRRNFFSLGNKIIYEAIQQKTHTTVGVVDIDFFKQINDTYGHDCGDEALKFVADIFKSTFKDSMIARLGGEEFGFIAQEKNFTESEKLVETFRTSLMNNSFKFHDNEIKLTASIGASYVLQNNLDETLKIADTHLYLAKKTGRNKTVWNHGKPAINA
jgi:diguanylate cyclase (GGDEF)-like protein